MRIPEHIVIKGEVWTIVKKDLSSHISYNDQGQMVGHAVGLCQPWDRTIYYHNTLKGDLLRSTILHEINHAILYETGFSQTSLLSDTEELIVENIANVYNRVFKKLVFDKPILILEKPKKKGKKKSTR